MFKQDVLKLDLR